MKYTTLAEIKQDGNSVENNIIKGLDICVIGHFGNVVCLDIWCENCSLFFGYSCTKNIGFQIKELVELFDLTNEDGYCLSHFKDIPCRTILEGDGGWGSKVLGFGHFMKDKFIYKENLARITGE